MRNPKHRPGTPWKTGKPQRDDWVAAVEQVISDAEAWATEQHWFVHRTPKTITEDDVGSYEVPSLLIQAPAGRFTLEPMGRYIIGATADGRYIGGAMGEIELNVYPSYEYVRIVRTGAGWHFVIKRPDSRSPLVEGGFPRDREGIGQEGMTPERRRIYVIDSI